MTPTAGPKNWGQTEDEWRASTRALHAPLADGRGLRTPCLCPVCSDGDVVAAPKQNEKRSPIIIRRTRKA